MGLYEVPLYMSLLGFGMGTLLANFHMCSIMGVQEVICVLGARCLVCRDPVSCNFFIAAWT